MKQICINGTPVRTGEGPLICAPIVGRTREQILAELAVVLPKRPDLLEWRVDFFSGIGDFLSVVEIAGAIKQAAGSIPLIFTCRSIREGGERVALDDQDILKLYVSVCASRCVDIIDYEQSNADFNLRQLRKVSRENAVLMIASYHNFQVTPDTETLLSKFHGAELLDADIAKVAVMPTDPGDVLTLLGATLQASRSCAIPLISMSMGKLGVLSRLFGWAYGSAMTFAVGNSSSAPGQVPIEELRTALSSVGITSK